jgi:response regulator RpfG family c-di-GMP phosphodiesterase
VNEKHTANVDSDCVETAISKYQILVIDDSHATRRGVKKILEPLNMEIAEASDGQQGLELAKNGEFDLIITDIDMPKMNGIELCRRLKNTQDTRTIPVIMLSSFDSEADINRGFQAGASAYISKKEARLCLQDSVKEILSKAKFQRERIIMVVDDSYMIRHLVGDGLAQAGFQVINAENGEKALHILENVRPDLILSDINMPQMDGFAFCEKVHANPELASIPFVVMSTNSDRSYMKRMLSYGAEAYLVKPFNIDQVVILIEKLLSDQFLLLLKEKERLDLERNLMLASITSLVTALESRDHYTRGHSEVVARIVSGMASVKGLSKEEIEMITIGVKLHDIGKIGISDNILLKPGRLTDEEFAHIKQHPTIGANILKSIHSLRDVLSIVQCHHERMDGKGYPHGLKGDEIPLWARMTAIADTYHALISDRPYREAMSQEKAFKIIDEVKGSQLCPECVDVFFKWASTQKSVPEWPK